LGGPAGLRRGRVELTILLLRHATAGHRQPGDEQDHLRPLDDRGRRQAGAYPELYAGYGVERVLTSPYTRCRQSVEPLAAALGLPVEERSELAEGSTSADVDALARELGATTAVLCTHGDVIDDVLGEESEKGSTWVLDGGLGRRAYLPPPA
jgi:phosphohistidine phosphatase SixA